ncbi:MAG: bifunctional ADP-dependent NAD(P)H-hydrate dehydratase/NAD(P)H-hydrate epimerase, partial [Sedimenticolaceae bacterium]
MTLRTLPDIAELPRALYTAAQVREFDRLAIERFEIAGLTLMERAGQAAFDLLRRSWPAARRLVVL